MQTIDNLELRIKKVRVQAPFDSKILEAKDAAVIARKLIGDQAQEHFLVFLLNTQNELTGYSLVAVGGLTSCMVDLRVVFRTAVLTGACAIVAIHNHPSQQLEPSNEDENITRRIRKASDLLGITLLDHIIVSQSAHFSLRESRPGLFAEVR
jgi:DNA repair protein RadC